MPELKIDAAEFRVQIARAGISHTRLCELADVHPNTITRIARGRGQPDLSTLAALVNALNIALAEEGQPRIHPFDLLEATGFEEPTEPSVSAPVMEIA
jgi:transcriptional regulator with XRE-family HTH domain